MNLLKLSVLILMLAASQGRAEINCSDVAAIDALSQQIKNNTAGVRKLKPDFILVSKATRKLYLLSDGGVLQAYNTAFGWGNPFGHKQQKGDGRTPEGLYTITQKNSQSRFHKSLKISYPNAEDIKQARVRQQDPGGMIMVHGLPSGGMYSEVASIAHPDFNWTSGCIAVTNAEIDFIFRAVSVGTPILICR